MESAAKRTRKRIISDDSSNTNNNNNRIRIRKPLSDVINTLNSKTPPSSSSKFSTKTSTSVIKPTQLLNPNTTQPQNDNTSSNPSDVLVNSISTPCQTPPKPSSDKGTAGASHEGFELLSVYSRRRSADKMKGKQKANAEPMSCFPVLKTQAIRDELNEGGVTGRLSKSCVLPHKKKRPRAAPKEDDAKHALPQDFIEQQRAYFAEIDAFELPEEEVASIDELD